MIARFIRCFAMNMAIAAVLLVTTTNFPHFDADPAVDVEFVAYGDNLHNLTTAARALMTGPVVAVIIVPIVVAVVLAAFIERNDR